MSGGGVHWRASGGGVPCQAERAVEEFNAERADEDFMAERVEALPLLPTELLGELSTKQAKEVNTGPSERRRTSTHCWSSERGVRRVPSDIILL